jgi:acetyl-CoA carboxylase carboxyltransferase component
VTGTSALSPSERLSLLVDDGSLELWPVQDGVSVLAASGRIERRPVLAYAQDGAVAGGSVGEAEAAVVVEVLRRSRDLGVPVISFIESAGARLQEGANALGAYGRIFYENVALSRKVPQISIITGTSAGGGCYSPALTDFVVMIESANMFLTGPRVVNEALNENVAAEALGGPRVHARNGVCDFVAVDETDAAALARLLLRYLPQRTGEHPPTVRRVESPPGRPDRYVPASPRRVYDVRGVVRSIVDGGDLLEVSPLWASNLVTGFAHVAGRATGIVANQPKVLGGVLDSAASLKGAGFVGLCSDYGIPLVVLVDTPGFLPGTKQEADGVISHGARLVRAFASASVPRVTVILRKAYGGAYIAMNAKSLGADMTFAWPQAEIGIIGARAAAKIVHRRELAVARDAARTLDRLASLYARHHLSPLAAARIGLIDSVIEPRRTREVVATALTQASPQHGDFQQQSRVRGLAEPVVRRAA